MADPENEPLIASASDLNDLVSHLREAGRFAFDTEFVSEDTFEPILCLIQVATRDRLAVVDPLAIRDLTPFWDVVTDPSIEVVMHAAGEDLRICRIRTGKLPRRVYDVQLAAGLVGFGYPLSLGNLIHQILRISLPGGETRTDWRRRPLTEAQARYALDDVRHLLDAADWLKARLDHFGRASWAEDEFRDFLDAIETRAEEDRWRRLPGLHQLNRRGLEVARRLSDWRQNDARRANRPLRSVLRDDLLIAIAKRQPTARRDLEALRDFNRPQLLNRSNDILAVIADALAVPNEELPEPPSRFDEPPGQAMVVSLLNAALSQSAAKAQISPALIGGSNDLKAVLRWFLDGQPEDRRPVLLQGWREEVCGRTILDVLSGQRSLRIVDPGAEVPVALSDTD